MSMFVLYVLHVYTCIACICMYCLYCVYGVYLYVSACIVCIEYIVCMCMYCLYMSVYLEMFLQIHTHTYTYIHRYNTNKIQICCKCMYVYVFSGTSNYIHHTDSRFHIMRIAGTIWPSKYLWCRTMPTMSLVALRMCSFSTARKGARHRLYRIFPSQAGGSEGESREARLARTPR